MISQEIKIKLLAFFQEILDRESILQQSKQQLANNPLANLKALFQRLDQNKNGRLGPRDLQKYVIESNIKYDQDSLYAVYCYFDYQRKGYISLANFILKIMPQWDSLSRQKMAKHPQYNGNQKLSQSIQQSFKNLFISLFQSFQAYQLCRSDLFNSLNFYIPTLFRNLDYSAFGYIANTHVQKFLQQNQPDRVFTQLEIKKIMRGLNPRFKKLTLQLFSQFLNPFQSPYQNYQQAKNNQLNQQQVLKQKNQQQKIKNNRLSDQKNWRMKQKLQREHRMKDVERQKQRKRAQQQQRRKKQQENREIRKRQVQKQKNSVLLANNYQKTIQTQKKLLEQEREKLKHFQQQTLKQNNQLHRDQQLYKNIDYEKDMLYAGRSRLLQNQLYNSQLDFDKQKEIQRGIVWERELDDRVRREREYVARELEFERQNQMDRRMAYEAKLAEQQQSSLARQKLRLKRQLQKTRAQLQLRKSNLRAQQLRSAKYSYY